MIVRLIILGKLFYRNDMLSNINEKYALFNGHFMLLYWFIIVLLIVGICFLLK